jgi:serine beta-lactamase-like protein LACTB
VILLAVMTALFLPAPVPAQTEATPVERTRRTLQILHSTLDIPGFSIAVSREGRILLSQGYGLADMEQEVPVTTDTRFRMCSVSKLITAAAVARLYQEDRLDLDAPIRTYVSSFPDKGVAITARQLAAHLGGIRHYSRKDFAGPGPIDFRHFDTVEEGLGIFAGDELIHPPGEVYSYSTFGYSLLSAAVEGASGLPFLDYLDARIFAPLGMTATGADDRRQVIPHRARFYGRSDDGEIVNADYVDPSYKWGGGGLLGTAEDLVRFGSAHLKPGFFNESTLKVLFTPQATIAGDDVGVGLGWRLGRDAHGRSIAHHAGSMAGCRAMLLVYLEQGLVVAMQSNMGSEPFLALETAQVIATPFLAEIESLQDAVAGFAGTHRFTGKFNEREISGVLQLEAIDGRLAGSMTMGEQVWSVVDVLSSADGYDLHLLHPRGGLMLLALKRDGQRLAGSIDAARHRLDVVVMTGS